MHSVNCHQYKQFTPLELETRPTVDTAAYAHYMHIAEQTARIHACKETGPIRPIRVPGSAKLHWPTAEIRRVLGVATTQKGFSTLVFMACILGVALLMLGILMAGPANLDSLNLAGVTMLGGGVMGKQHGNTLWLADKGHGNALIQMARAAIIEHGMPPNDAAVAAAHEAGHVIVGLAMGGKFGEAFIEPNAGRWEGFSKVSIPGVHSKEDCNILANPRRGWLLGLPRAGGIHGEMFIGQYHPASSIDEAFVMNVSAPVEY
jgi:hypothetical protein